MSELTAVDNRQQAIKAVLDSVQSAHTKRAYERSLTEFMSWHSTQGQPPLTKALVNQYKTFLQEQGKGASVINQQLSAIRKLVREAADSGAIDPVHANGIANVKGVKSETLPAGRAVTSGEIEALINACLGDRAIGARDAAIIAIAYACGLRRSELVELDLDDYDPTTSELKIQHAKGNKSRVVYVTNGSKDALDDWLEIRGQEPGPLFVVVRKGGHIRYHRLTTQAIYKMLNTRAEQASVKKLSPHDLRRTVIGDLLDHGVDIKTVSDIVGHSSVETTARYDRRPDERKRKASETLHVPYRRRG